MFYSDSEHCLVNSCDTTHQEVEILTISKTLMMYHLLDAGFHYEDCVPEAKKKKKRQIRVAFLFRLAAIASSYFLCIMVGQTAWCSSYFLR